MKIVHYGESHGADFYVVQGELCCSSVAQAAGTVTNHCLESIRGTDLALLVTELVLNSRTVSG